MLDTSDDEWEWEYDSTETETFLLTLDLSAVASAMQATVTPHVQPDRAPLEIYDEQAHNTTEEMTNAHQHPHANLHNALGIGARLDKQGIAAAKPAASQNDLQILDLHGPNPIIAYRGKLLSCHWASSLGTDLFFAETHTSSELQHSALRSLSTSYDLLGAGSARLVAIDADLQPREVPQSVSALESFRSEGTEQNGSIVNKPQRKSIKVAVRDSATTHERNQARFLERLDAIKARRGDTDQVHTGRGYRPKNASRPIFASVVTPSGDAIGSGEHLTRPVDLEEDDITTVADDADLNTWGPGNIARRNRPFRRTRASLFGGHNQFRRELHGALTGRVPITPARPRTEMASPAIEPTSAGGERLIIEEGEGGVVEPADSSREADDVEMEDMNTA